MKKLLSVMLLFFCITGLWAEDVNISNATEMQTFVSRVNAGENTLNAKLTADIDLGTIDKWVAIGTDEGSGPKRYKGTFDGQGFRIKNMKLDGSKKEQGFFGVVAAGATIKNLIIDESCVIEGKGENGSCQAAFVGCTNGNGTITFENCGNEAEVKGVKQNNAAFVGCNYGNDCKLVFNNCYNAGKISGGWENGAFSGWCGGGATFNNCYNIGDVQNGETWARGSKTINNCYQTVGSDGGVTKTTNEKVASGELAFLLNGGVTGGEKWYQNLSTPKDAHPVPFASHGKVYANGEQNCDGSDKGVVTYSNTNTGFRRDPHTDVDGFCSVCHQVVPDHLAPVEGYYQIGTANDLKWFASYVMDVEATAKAKLTANINYSANNNDFIGVPGKPFKGEFDGQEHTITIAIQNREGVNRTGLFAAIDGATIKNLVVEGTATSNNQNCVGGLGGRSDGASVVENVVVKTAVSYTGSNGDATCGGFFANMESSATLKNCAFLGSIDTGSAEGNGGLVGWAGGGNNNKYINCLVAPTSYTKNGNSADFARNNPTKTNCHFVASDDARLATGELCYTLNAGGDNWYQTLTTDVTPVPFSSHSKVYANASYNCDGTPKGAVVYANVNEEHHDPHTLNGGFCDVCNAMVEYVANYMTPAADDWYEISNNKQMRWFAAKVKTYRVASNDDSNARINARLMNDIDFEGVTDYKPIGGLWGQGNARYAGEFDGQFHKITNLKIDLDQDNVGIFGVIAEGAVIKNFTVDASCSIKGKGHVGIVGEAWRSHNGEFHLICLGNEANITGTGNNVGGILGVNMNNNGYAKCNMVQCYSTGHIKGAGENGQLTGWSGDNAVIENCYAIGEMEKCDIFGRLGNGSTITNCYSGISVNWGEGKVSPTHIEDGQLASGELCYKLGDKNFRQEIGVDDHPVLSDTKPNVKKADVTNMGYATYVPDTDVKFNAENLEAYAITSIENGSLILASVDKVPAGEAVVLKADEGSYYINTTADAEKPATNLLKAATEDLTAAQMQDANPTCTKFYALGLNKAGEASSVGFYWIKEDGSAFDINKGKGYLALSGQTKIRGFRFGEGEEATGIESLKQQTISGAIYNLQGQRVGANAKGIVIMNGKKVFVK